MSAYSALSEEQTLDLESAIGAKVLKMEAIESGVSNSIYKTTLQTAEGLEEAVVIISETPDRTAFGVSADESANIPELMFYMADKIGIKGLTDRDNAPVNTVVPMPYIWNNTDKSRIMQFEHASEDRLVDKTVFIIPFVNGRELDWDMNKCQNINDITQAGKGLAIFHTASEGFPLADRMANPFGFEKWIPALDDLLSRPESELNLNSFLQQKGSSLQVTNVLQTLSNEAKYIQNEWSQKTSELPKGIIHGDYFPDNMIMSTEGKQVILDFGNSCHEVQAYDIALALNAWTSENGKHSQRNIQAFLEGYDSVKELDKDTVKAIPFLGRAVSFSRALLRTEIALNSEQAEHANSPEECLTQLAGWRIKEKNNIQIFKSSELNNNLNR